MPEGVDLPGKNLAVAIIVGNRRQGHRIGIEADGRIAVPLMLKSADELGGAVLRLGRASPVATRIDCVLTPQSVNADIHSRRQGSR